MADLSITAANVKRKTGAVVVEYVAGETITAGQTLYVDSTTGKAMKAMCDGTAAQANVIGIALNGASLDQPVDIQTAGRIALGTGTEGMVYTLSDTAGGIAAHSDADDPVSTEYTSIVGVGNDGTDGTGLDLCIFPTVYQTA